MVNFRAINVLVHRCCKQFSSPQLTPTSPLVCCICASLQWWPVQFSRSTDLTMLSLFREWWARAVEKEKEEEMVVTLVVDIHCVLAGICIRSQGPSHKWPGRPAAACWTGLWCQVVWSVRLCLLKISNTNEAVLISTPFHTSTERRIDCIFDAHSIWFGI